MVAELQWAQSADEDEENQVRRHVTRTLPHACSHRDLLLKIAPVLYALRNAPSRCLGSNDAGDRTRFGKQSA
jgi:hypothetical protein